LPIEIVPSIIVPAHNEQAVVSRSIESLQSDAAADSFQVILVANGCSDRTAEVARRAWDRVDVVETDIPSKSNALNLGDAKATGFPRFYMDADITLSPDAISIIGARMAETGALAAAPAMEMRFTGTSWPVRAYYRVWQRLPYVKEGMIGVGIYALSEEGRRRFDRFPSIIADDGFIRRLFKPHERLCVEECRSIVTAPSSLWGLIKIKSRSRLGGYELSEKFPELSQNEPKGYGDAFWGLARRPALWPALVVYVGVNLIARLRATKMHRGRAHGVWERDDTSRQ
jgi:glycosyltransferase involved in cell wall biosynthesis